MKNSGEVPGPDSTHCNALTYVCDSATCFSQQKPSLLQDGLQVSNFGRGPGGISIDFKVKTWAGVGHRRFVPKHACYLCAGGQTLVITAAFLRTYGSVYCVSYHWRSRYGIMNGSDKRPRGQWASGSKC